MNAKLVYCDLHGQSPCYVVCPHVFDGVYPSSVEAATETKIGQALCAECSDLTEDQLREKILETAKVVCAGCFANLQKPTA